jgi:hypothetical protein
MKYKFYLRDTKSPQNFEKIVYLETGERFPSVSPEAVFDNYDISRQLLLIRQERSSKIEMSEILRLMPFFLLRCIKKFI